MKKNNIAFCITLFLVLNIFPSSFTCSADSNAVPVFRSAGDDTHYPPEIENQDLLDLFYEFEQLYWQRQDQDYSFPDKWKQMGDKLSRELGIRAGEDIYQQYIRYSAQKESGLNLYVRAFLLMGESYLFASQGYFQAKDPRFQLFYEQGIVILQSILTFVESWAEDSTDLRAEVVFLPAFSQPRKSGPFGGRIHYLPYAGFETIGTGFEKPIGVITRNVSYDQFGRYDSLIKYREVLDMAGSITQISTTQTARELLSHFCPWGVGIYFWLKEAGLMEQIDFHILRPYAQGLDKNFLEKVNNNLEILFSGNELFPSLLFSGSEFPAKLLDTAVWLFSASNKYTAFSDWPPLVSDLTIPDEMIPPMVKARMNCIVEEEKCIRTSEEKERLQSREMAYCRDIKEVMAARGGVRASRIDTLSFHSDIVGDLGDRQIRWLWVSEPTYNLWYVSPVIHNWKASDYVNVIFNLYKWASGGVVLGAVNVGMDALGAEFLEGYFHLFNASPVPVPLFSNVLKEGFIDQYGAMVKSERVSVYNTLKAGDWMDGKDLLMDITLAAFEALETSNRETLFGGIDPEQITMGMTYNGSPIPPVLLVSNVVGVQDVLDNEYPNHINITRFFVMDPKIGSRSLNYNLDDSPLSGMKNSDLCVGWSPSKSPLPSLTVITSFAPSAQILTFQLDAETTGLITDSDAVTAELWATTLEDESKYATAYIERGDRSFTITLFNKDQPDASADYRRAMSSPGGTVHIGGAVLMVEESSDSRKLGAHKGEYHTALVSLKTQYDLRLNVNGSKQVYPVNLYQGSRGAGRIKKPITGTLSVSSLGPGYQALDYERVIQLPVGTVQKEALEQGAVAGSAEATE
jgi:hypothetical protein